MRGEIGFDGLILSDDVSMKALKGPYEERAAAIIDAGLDIVLHCNGELDEARAVASATPELSGRFAAPRQGGAGLRVARRSRSTSSRASGSSRPSQPNLASPRAPAHLDRAPSRHWLRRSVWVFLACGRSGSEDTLP